MTKVPRPAAKWLGIENAIKCLALFAAGGPASNGPPSLAFRPVAAPATVGAGGLRGCPLIRCLAGQRAGAAGISGSFLGGDHTLALYGRARYCRCGWPLGK